ncbi:MAG: hypothetical protein HY696_12180 [Deltaproteobacteria bacterium]|nr:hypothetical protein [Deltaproteobacteria bacterium]
MHRATDASGAPRMRVPVAGSATLITSLFAGCAAQSGELRCSVDNSEYEAVLSPGVAIIGGVALLAALTVGGYLLHRRGFQQGAAVGERRGRPRGFSDGFAKGQTAGRAAGRLEPRTVIERAYADAERFVGTGEFAVARIVVDGAIAAAQRTVDLAAQVHGLCWRARIETYLGEYHSAEETYRRAIEVLSQRHDILAEAGEAEQAHGCRRNIARLLLAIAYVKMYRGKPTQQAVDKEFPATIEQARAMFIEHDDVEGWAATYVAEALMKILWHGGIGADGALFAARRRLETYPAGEVDLDPNDAFERLQAEVGEVVARTASAEVKPDLGPQLLAALEGQLMRGALNNAVWVARRLADHYDCLGVTHLTRAADAWAAAFERIAPQLERMRQKARAEASADADAPLQWRRTSASAPDLPPAADPT